MQNDLRSETPDMGVGALSDRQQRIYNFLHSNPIGVLSSVGIDSEPHGAVIYFTIDKQFIISFLTKTHTRKCDNLRHHARVMLTVFDPYTQSTAQIMGDVTEVKDKDKINAIASAVHAVSLETSNAGMPPISKLNAGKYVAFSFALAQIRMGAYANPNPVDYTELFETVETFELRDN